jgi:hypothetical protein
VTDIFSELTPQSGYWNADTRDQLPCPGPPECEMGIHSHVHVAPPPRTPEEVAVTQTQYAPQIVDRLQIFPDEVNMLGRVPGRSARVIVVEHVLEYLTQDQRIDFFNQAYRILTDDGVLNVTVPYHSHPRGFAHPLIQWPPFSEHSFLFLDREWREEKPERAVPALACDFPVPPVMTFAYGYDDQWSTRSSDTLAFAVEHYLGVVVELYVTLTKRTGATNGA